MELCAKVISFGVWCTSQLSSALPLPLKVVNQRNDSLILPGSLEHSWRLPVESFLWACGLKEPCTGHARLRDFHKLGKGLLGRSEWFFTRSNQIFSGMRPILFKHHFNRLFPNPGESSPDRIGFMAKNAGPPASPRLEGMCCFMASRHPAWVNQSFGAQAHGKCVL